MAINPNFVPTLEPINNYTSDRIINTDKVIVEGTPSTGLVSFDKILGGKDDVALKYHYTNSPSPTSPTSSDTRYVNITNLKRTSPRILEGNDTDGNKVIIKEVTLSGTTTVKVYINGNVVENSLSSLGSRTVSLVSNTAKLLEGSATSTSGETSYPYYSISPRELYALTVLEVLLNKENDIFSKTNSYINALIDKAFNIARLFYGKAVICRVYDGLGTGSVVPYDLLPVANHTATNMLATCEFIYTPISGITPELSWVIFDSILGLNDTVAIRYFYDDLVSSANDVIIYDTISNLKRVSPRILEGVNTNGEVITIKESTCTISDVVVPCISVLKNGELYFNLVGNLDVAHPTKSYPETTDPLVATKTYLLSLLTIGLDLAQDDSSTTLSYKDTSPRERYTIVALKSLLELEDNILDKSNAYLNGLVDKAFLISRAFLGKARMSRLDIDGLPGNAEVKDVRLVTSGNPSIVNSDGIALIPTASSTHNYGLVAIDNNTITLNSSGLILANGGGSGTITDVRVNNASVVPSGSTIANIPLASTSNHGAMSSSDKTKLNNIESGAEVNVLSDWNLTNTSSDDYIKNKPTIPTVSIDTDDYYITVNGTSIGTEDAPIGWAWEALLAYKDEDGNFIKETYQTKISSTNKVAASNISGLSTVATSGSYSDLTNKPTIPTESTVSGWGFTKNTGTVTKVTVGSTEYTPSSGVITLPEYQTKISSTNKIAASNVSGLATVATSGSYNDLTNKPTIPSTANLVTTNTAQTISGVKTFSNHLYPTTESVYLGLDNKRWGAVFANQFNGDTTTVLLHYFEPNKEITDTIDGTYGLTAFTETFLRDLLIRLESTVLNILYYDYRNDIWETWNTTSINNLFDNDPSTIFYIPYDYRLFRFEITSSNGWSVPILFLDWTWFSYGTFTRLEDDAYYVTKLEYYLNDTWVTWNEHRWIDNYYTYPHLLKLNGASNGSTIYRITIELCEWSGSGDASLRNLMLLTNYAGNLRRIRTTDSNNFLIDGGLKDTTVGGNITTHFGDGTFKYEYTKPYTTGGLFPATNNANAIITLNRHSGNYDSLLGFSSNGNIYYRSFNNAALDTTTTWKKLIFDSDVATTSSFGVVKPDGTTITINNGVISAVSGGSGTITGVSINGSSIATSGVADIPLASSSANGAMSITDKVKLDKVAVYSDITVLALINQTLTTALVHNLHTYINNNEVGLFIDSGANSYVSVNVDASSNPTAILSFLFNNKVYLATLTSSDTLELTVTDLSKMPYVPISTLPIQVGTYNLSLMDSYGLTTTVIGDMMNGTITRVKIGTDIWEVFGCANYGSTDKHFHFRFYDYHGFTQFLDISYNGSNYIVDYREVIG